MERHSVNIEGRQRLTVTDVCSLDTFDEGEVVITLSEGGIQIKGHQLHIHMLDLESGTAIVTGRIDEMTYIKKKSEKKLMGRFFK